MSLRDSYSSRRWDAKGLDRQADLCSTTRGGAPRYTESRINQGGLLRRRCGWAIIVVEGNHPCDAQRLGHGDMSASDRFFWAAIVCLSAVSASGVPADPPSLAGPRTPETATLSSEAAAQVLERDWLFQAMGEPLLSRTALELDWARQLAARLTQQHPALDLSAELTELNALQRRLEELRTSPTAAERSPAPAAEPSWIWYPEGDSTQNAPAAVRFFRCRFEIPSQIRSATLRVAADDACEVFLNGTRVGGQDTWQRRRSSMPVPSCNPVRISWRCARRIGRLPAAIPPA